MSENEGKVTIAYERSSENMRGEVLEHSERSIVYACLYLLPETENPHTAVPFTSVSDARAYIDAAFDLQDEATPSAIERTEIAAKRMLGSDEVEQ